MSAEPAITSEIWKWQMSEFQKVKPYPSITLQNDWDWQI